MNAHHLLADLFECESSRLNDPQLIREAMLGAARSCGATIVADSVHQFSPQGVSGVVVIAESHLTIHTWPQEGYAAIDVFTCGVALRAEKAVRHLAAALGSTRQRVTEVPRGIDPGAMG